MAKIIARRLLSMVITLAIVSVLIFAVSELAPGNIAVNTLGNTITPAQEASFNAQNGLDQPAITRYVRWMFGSDWQASRLLGMGVTQIYEPDADRYSWWGVKPDGTLVQHYTTDGEQMIQIEWGPDGSLREVPLGPEVWQPNDEGIPVFWGMDRSSRAAMWVRGDQLQQWTLTKATWTSEKGAPRQYIPLQRGLARGDPGTSFETRRPVGETLWPRLFNTLLLAAIAFAIIMPLALLLGLFAGLYEGKWIDRVLSVGGLVATATPEFASGVFLILIFASWLKILPGSVVTSSGGGVLANPAQLVLPILTLTLAELGYVLRITRASMVEVMRTNYIRTAVLKGLPQRQIVFKHALRNALMAPITVIILHANWLIGGIVVVEMIFGYPGLGRYVLEAALFKDVFAIEAAAMILVVIAVVTQLFADTIYTYLNPRIRFA
jgi:peptide/nickel transport system permease protein